jgi:hypothetical protein
MSARRQSIVIKITSRFFGMLGALEPAPCADAAGTVLAVVLAPDDALVAAIADPPEFAVVGEAFAFCETSAAGARAQLASAQTSAAVAQGRIFMMRSKVIREPSTNRAFLAIRCVPQLRSQK